MKCVILAGGSGTRFWPYSRHHHPKQLLNIIGDTSMLQMTVDRLKKIKKVTDIYIITRKNLYDFIIQNIKGIKPDHVIVEPSGKNTAPAIGMMAAYLAIDNPDAVMGIFPADHLIVGHRKFEKAVSTASHLAKKEITWLQLVSSHIILQLPMAISNMMKKVKKTILMLTT